MPRNVVLALLTAKPPSWAVGVVIDQQPRLTRDVIPTTRTVRKCVVAGARAVEPWPFGGGVASQP